MSGVWALCWLALCQSGAWGQLPQARLYAVFPLGGQAGTAVDVSPTNAADLEELTELRFSHPGITATPKMQSVNGANVPVPGVFTVQIAADVPVGKYEVRARGLYGLSTPRRFVVGDNPEKLEVEPNNTSEQATPLALDETVNAKIQTGTDIDYYRFTAQAGQRLIGECLARQIDSKLDATVEVYDLTRRRLAFVRSGSRGDPLLDFKAPVTGEYLLKIYDFVYAGSEDYGYRFTLKTKPHVDFIWPPGGVPGTTSPFVLYGRNLPGGVDAGVARQGFPLQKLAVDIAVPAEPDRLDPWVAEKSTLASADGFAYRWTGPTGSSNPVLVSFASSTITAEVEPNDAPAEAMTITAPGEYAGQFQKKGDVDLFQFAATAGQSWTIEVIGQRLGQGADPYLIIDQVTKNEQGVETLKRIGNPVDDEGTNPLANVFDTLHDDPLVKFTAPAEGTYRLTLRDRYNSSRGDPSLVYRLSLRPEQPDFRLVAVPIGPAAPPQKTATPWAMGLRKGDQAPLQVIALRRDGLTAPIDVTVEGLPAGVTCREISIGTTPSAGVLVLSAAEDAAPYAGTVKVVGKAKVDDPAKLAAAAQTQTELATATTALLAAEQVVAKAQAELDAKNTALAAAKAELANAADNEELKKKVADAEAAVVTAQTQHQQAVEARGAAEQKRVTAVAAADAAEQARVAAIRELVHTARVGTIVWPGQPNIPGEPRLTETLELSVMDELAPFTISTDVHRVIAHHSRQILVPVALTKRPGFDANVNLTFVGTPPNVQVENKPIDKDKGSEVFRMFVPPNAPVGTYVMYLGTQAQVSFQRNPGKAAKKKAEFEAADQANNAALEAQKAAQAVKDKAAQDLVTAQAALKTAVDAKAAADKAVTDAQAAVKAAEDAVKAAGENADAKAAAEKQLTDAQTALVAAQKGQLDAEQVRVTAEAGVKTAETAKTKSDSDFTAAEAAAKTATAARAAAEKESQAAENAAKPQNINYFPTTSPIVLTILPAPVTVAAAPAEGGAIKQGQKLEVKVDIKRQNNFVGPVTLTLPLPPGVTGLTAAPVTIPADQTSGVLVVEAAADAAESQPANLVVRATGEFVSGDFRGPADVDQPVTLKIVKP
jgi:multidrug efflux pump subunit AcrA (membrane-fusion protein)